jgi:hypothetical protein
LPRNKPDNYKNPLKPRQPPPNIKACSNFIEQAFTQNLNFLLDYVSNSFPRKGSQDRINRRIDKKEKSEKK